LLGNVKIRSFGKIYDQVSWNKLGRENVCRLKKLKNNLSQAKPTSIITTGSLLIINYCLGAASLITRVRLVSPTGGITGGSGNLSTSFSDVATLAAHPKFVWVFNANCDGTIIFNDPVLILLFISCFVLVCIIFSFILFCSIVQKEKDENFRLRKHIS
jgi:hypothetical protein